MFSSCLSSGLVHTAFIKMSSITRKILWVSIGVIAVSPVSFAGNWTSNWGFGTGLVYTDNVNLAPEGEEESDLFLNINPSVQFRKTAGRSSTNLFARADAFLSLIGSGNSQINPTLQFGNSLEVLKQRFFIDTNASVRRSFSLRDDAVSTTRLSNSGFNTGNIRISPLWQEHLGTFADFTARYDYDFFLSGRDTVSNTNSHGVNLQATSGRGTPRLIWDGFYRYRKSVGGNDNKFGSARFNLAYNFIGDLQFVATFGTFDSQADQGDVPGVNDGSLGRAGLSWTPTPLSLFSLLAGPGNWAANAQWGNPRKFRLVGRYGRNGRDDFSDLTGGRPFWDARAIWNPSPRTSLDLAYFRPEFGANSERASWNGEIAFERPRSRLSVRVTQDTTTTQQLLQQTGFLLDPVTGAPQLDPNGNLILQTTPFISDNDQIFISRCLEVNASRQSRKNNFTVRMGVERRDFDSSSDDEQIYGGSFLWSYSFNPRTTLDTQLGYLNTQFNNDGTEDQQYLFRTSLGKRLGRQVSVNLQYALNRRDSNDGEREFTENSVFLNFNFGRDAGRGGFAGGGLGTGGGFVAGGAGAVGGGVAEFSCGRATNSGQRQF